MSQPSPVLPSASFANFRPPVSTPAGTAGPAPAMDDNGQFSLASGAEEITLHMQHKVEERHHSERKVGAEKNPRRVSDAEIIDLNQHAHEPDTHARLMELTRHLLSGREGPRKLVSQGFSDVTQQYLALQYALRHGEDHDGNAEVLQELRDALADMEVEHGPRIRAGINTLPAAGAFASGPKETWGFVDTYRDIVLGEKSLAQTLKLALERFGGNDIDRAVRQLANALGFDLAATEQSVSRERLTMLVSDLYQLQVAVTVLEDCAQVGARMADIGYDGLDKNVLMHDVVGLSASRWLDADSVGLLAQKRGIVPLDHRFIFLRGVQQIIKDLPVQVYPDIDTRNAVLGAFQARFDLDAAEEDQA